MTQVKIIGTINKPYQRILIIKRGKKIEQYILDGFKGYFEAEVYTLPRKLKPRIRIIGNKKKDK